MSKTTDDLKLLDCSDLSPEQVQRIWKWHQTVVKTAQAELLERLMKSREIYSPVTNGHIHVKNVDYEYWKLTGRSLL